MSLSARFLAAMSLSTKLLADLSVCVAVLTGMMGAFLGYVVLTSDDEPWAPVEFLNPALIEYEDGSVPTIEGVEGPAVYLGDPGEPVLPITWSEINHEDFPVSAMFTASVATLEYGETYLISATGTERTPFAPGTHTYHSLVAIPDPVRKEVLILSGLGICQSSWQRVTHTTPHPVDSRDVVSAEFVSQSYTIVVEDCDG